VASLIGVVRRNQAHVPAKLLLPLNYATILGGTLCDFYGAYHLSVLTIFLPLAASLQRFEEFL